MKNTDLIKKIETLVLQNDIDADLNTKIVYAFAIYFYGRLELPSDWYTIHKQNLVILFGWDFTKSMYEQDDNVLKAYITHIVSKSKPLI